MKRCCCDNCKKVKIKVKKNEIITNTNESLDTFVEKFNIREKRIGIVFKVIYVIAALFVSGFLLVANEVGKGLTDTYIAYVCVVAFLIQFFIE